MSVLQGMRIVETAESAAGEYCGKLLADFGAEVVKVERPGLGSPTRSMAPVIEGSNGAKESGLFAYLNTNKRSVALDVAAPVDVSRLHALIGSAAAVIDDHGQDWLSRLGLSQERFEREFPNAVFSSVTSFGLLAPSDFEATKSINVMHASGWGYHMGPADDLSKPPLKGPGRFLGDYDAGLDAAMATMAALVQRERTGLGDYVDTSQQAALVSRADHIVGRLLAGELPAGDSRTTFDNPGPTGAYRCADGYIHLYVTPVHWRSLIEILGNPDWTADFADDWLFNTTPEIIAAFRKHFVPWVADKKRDELCEEAQRRGVPIVAVNDLADLLKSEQLEFRGFFQKVDHPVLGKAPYPTVPYKLGRTPVRLNRPAPALGEHDELLSAIPEPASPSVPAMGQSDKQGPLAGIRILELTKVWAGPYAGKLLGFLGAEVIKVESRKTLDSMRMYQTDDIDRSPIFQSLNPGVRSVQLEMKTEKGLQLLREMIAVSDVVIDNLRPGAMARMGLDYEGMQAIRKDIIAVSLKMNGGEGPLSHQTGYASSFAALSGINALVGYEGETPQGMHQSYGDTTAGAAFAFATAAAIMHRERTGEGQFVDVSATEALTTMIGDSLLGYSLTGEPPRYEGNFHPDMAPHGTYPCIGGEWISIAVDTEEAWQGLCDVLKAVEMKDDPRFANLQARQDNLEALDREISWRTMELYAAPLAAMLRQAGVPALKSQNSLDLISDNLLWQRRAFTGVTDAFGCRRAVVGAPWRFARAGTVLSRGAPLLGEHNAYVYCDLLGRSKSELDGLIAEGVVN